MRKVSVLGVGVVVAWALACGGGSDAPPFDAIVETLPADGPPVVVPAVPEPIPAPAPASRCPDGVHAADLWQGEYPSPVVDVKSKVSVPGRAAACDGAPKGPCTIAPGLYHPWSQTTAAKFATLRPIVKFAARRPWTGTADDGKAVSVPAGGEIEVLAYFGEGYCQWRVGGSTLTAMCPEMQSDDQGDLFEALPAPAFGEIQALGVTCGEGHEAWIDVDEALFALPEIEEGAIVGYGEIAPSGTPGGL